MLPVVQGLLELVKMCAGGGKVTGKGLQETLSSHPDFAWLGGLLLWLWGSAMSSHINAAASDGRGEVLARYQVSTFRRSL